MCVADGLCARRDRAWTEQRRVEGLVLRDFELHGVRWCGHELHATLLGKGDDGGAQFARLRACFDSGAGHAHGNLDSEISDVFDI